MAKQRQYPGVYAYEAGGETLYRAAYRDSNGKQITRRGFSSPRAAATWRGEQVVKAAKGELRSTRQTFESFFDEWLADRRPYITAGTWRDYSVQGRHRLKPFFGSMRLPAITTQLVRAFMAEQAEKVAAGKLSPTTVNNALTVLVVCLTRAAGDGLIPANPAQGIERLPLGHVERDYLRLAEIGGYLDACSTKYRPLAEILVACGPRIGEALALTWDDVDFARSRIQVNRQHQGRIAVQTKGKKSRWVDMGPGLAQTLRDLRARQSEANTDDLSRALIFDVCRDTVSNHWHKDALERAKLRDMPLHSLRHTAAAAWLVTGQPLMYVQRQLGHATITTTEAFYGHLEESFLKTAAADTEAAIRAAVKDH